MKQIYIVNPIAFNKKAIDYANILNKNEVIYTKSPLDAQEISRVYSHKEEIETINVIGGDGTVNGVLNGMYGTNKKLGIIPTGINNNIYNSVKDKKTSDIGVLNGHLFLSSAVIGMPDVEINSDTYLNNVLRYFFEIQFSNMIALIDSKCKIIDTLLFAICNGPYIDNGVKINKQAQIDDGLFELYIINNQNRLRFLKTLLKLFSTNNIGKSNGKKIQISKLEADLLGKLTCYIDGEKSAIANISFRIIKEGIKIHHDKQLLKTLNLIS
ncbi:MAG: diacylglycerol kinase family protein [Bacilli bacterium]